MALTASVRAYLAAPIVLVVATLVAVVLIALLGLVGPGSTLVARGRLPSWWRRFTAWARSRSLRVWCPHPATRRQVAAHLQSPRGRRLSRLGVSVATAPGDADVLLVARRHEDEVAEFRRAMPVPTASVVLVDPADPDEFADAMGALAAALRRPADPADGDAS